MKAELWHRIHGLRDEGFSLRQIARHLRIHRRTVRAALASSTRAPAKRRPRGSLIDPYRGWLLAKLQQYPDLTATRLFRMVRETGYPGGYNTVKRCVAELRPRLKPAYLTLSFDPGECAQVDWGVWKNLNVPGGQRRISFFVMVLCHSRMIYVELFLGEAMEHWLTAHRNAFDALGGVPRKVMVDNCKTAVLVPCRAEQPAQFNPAYLDFAAHYGFRPVACNPGRPNEKGRVENAVGFVKSSFLAGREPAALEAMAPALADWLDTVANTRVHRATNRRPAELFEEVERGALRPLPAAPHECAVVRPVVATSTFRVTVATNRYSVPCAHASRRLSLRLLADRVVLSAPSGEVVADHPRNYGRHRDIVDPDHGRELESRLRHGRDHRRIESFLALGTAAEAYLAGLREKRPAWRGHVDRILALAGIHGRDPVARLLMDALEHHAFSSEYVLNILEARSRALPEPGPLHVTRRSDLLDLEVPKPNLDIYSTENER